MYRVRVVGTSGVRGVMPRVGVRRRCIWCVCGVSYVRRRRGAYRGVDYSCPAWCAYGVYDVGVMGTSGLSYVWCMFVVFADGGMVL